MSQIQTVDREDYDPSWITGKALEHHFSMREALFEFSRLFRDEENDRALAIVGGAFLDSLLENILVEFLVDDEKEVGELLRYDGAMGTYSGRIRAAYCLGLLRKTVRDDLRLVGKIRNRFAHDLTASFAEDPIRSWCNARTVAPRGLHGAAPRRVGARPIPRRRQPTCRPPQRLRLDRAWREEVSPSGRLTRSNRGYAAVKAECEILKPKHP